MAYMGKFRPENLQKYKGDWSKITYRSSWEHFLMKWLDNHPQVVRWNSEEVVIPYFSRADQKKRRYFMDFWARFDLGPDENGIQQFQEFFFEVKPFKETQEPKKPVQITTHTKKRYMNEYYTWCVNSDKWAASKIAADKNNIKFRLLTEKGLKQLGFKGC